MKGEPQGAIVSSIIIVSVPFHGHVTPLLTVAESFVNRGDTVRFVTGSRFADKVRATGASYVPLPTEADYDDRSILGSFPERTGLKGVKAIAFDVEHVVARPAKAQYETLMAALGAHLPTPSWPNRFSSAPCSCWRTRVRRVRRSSFAASPRCPWRAAIPLPSGWACRRPAYSTVPAISHWRR